MADDMGLDIVGAGKLAKAIPQKAWMELVETACSTFKSAIAPLTATTSGIGRLIEAKFGRLVEAEKLLAADVMARAAQKIGESKRKPNGRAKANVVIAAIEASASETDAVLRELWSNLIAQEICEGDVHPEFLRILARLSASDAQLLAQIAGEVKDMSITFRRAFKAFASSVSIVGASIDLIGSDDETSFAHEHLRNLHLIGRDGGHWSLSLTGKAFVEAVSDASQGDSAASQ